MFSHSCRALRHLLYPHCMASKTIPWHTRHRCAVRDVHAPKGEDVCCMLRRINDHVDGTEIEIIRPAVHTMQKSGACNAS
eukprot:156819-Chlamydomonas_euryale.AAC.1